MRRGKADEKKAEQERLQNILLDMLKEDENKYCADCQAKTPRWAAWNLGVFICIRCAGIHRNLGVHISKVRSVNLDTWTPEQVYEHSLPDHFRRSMADHQMEQFIRAKYEQKRYMLNGFVYPRVDVNDLPKAGQPVGRSKPMPPVSVASSATVRVAAALPEAKTGSAVVNDLLDFSSPASSATNVNGNNALVGDLASLSLQQEASTDQAAEFDDVFGSFASAPVIDTMVAATASQQASPVSKIAPDTSITSQSAGDLMSLSSGLGMNGEKKSNADILSLFGDQTKGPTQPIVPVGGFAAFGLQAAPTPQTQHQPGMPAFGRTPVVGDSTAPPFAAVPSLSNVGFANAIPPVQHNMVTPQSFPNPFDQPHGGLIQGLPYGTSSSTSNPSVQHKFQTSPTTPTSCSSRANNAFADLSIGKVLNMNYMNQLTAYQLRKIRQR
ncbi:hypothetical protein Q1695_004773 [Nippostrongylus brasiliensis]|nr:hypothetical protein Q1695_004773 [Nippostrongylus brasiliensis]